jgi:PBP1b-binding outer membrane lipoprotein LpoB
MQVMTEMESIASRLKQTAHMRIFVMFMLIAFIIQLCEEATASVKKATKETEEPVVFQPSVVPPPTAVIIRCALKASVNATLDMKETLRICK